MVQDLRAVNEIVVKHEVKVANPHTILNSISPEAKWFSVIDLSNAFFSVPLTLQAQAYFGFQYKEKFYTYTRLPQGFVNSPTIYSQALQDSLQTCPSLQNGQLLQYVDDLLITGHSQQDCKNNTIKVLQHLSKEGHKVSKAKLQWAKQEVVYLGHSLSGEGRRLLEDRKLVIRNAPRPKNKQEMMSFLGLCNYCRTWIPEYAVFTQPLMEAIHGQQMAMHDKILWTPEREKAFTELKIALQTQVLLALPDYRETFHLMVAHKDQYMTAVLLQTFGDKKRPLAFYSKKMDSIVAGFPDCVKGCCAAHEAVLSCEDIVLGHPLVVYTPHQTEEILLHAHLPFVTHARHLQLIKILLSRDHITMTKCQNVNIAECLATPLDGTAHDCKTEIQQYMQPRNDISTSPLQEGDVVFVDGSASKDQYGTNRVGYSVVMTDQVVEAKPLAATSSAQTAELTAIIRACQLFKGKTVTIYTDSQYAFGAVHHFAKIWKNRGFKTSTGKQLTHAALLEELLQAIQLPSKLALCKCAAHQTDDSPVTRGNIFADKAAKAAAQECHHRMLTTHSTGMI